MVRFSWHVFEKGYEWRDIHLPGTEDVAGPSLCLVPINRHPWRSYEPLEDHTGLFRNFAEVEPTRDGIRAFANDHGNLGVELDLLGEMEGPPEPTCEEPQTEKYYHAVLLKEAENLYRNADTFVAWREAIKQMRECVALWDQVRKGSLGGNERNAAEQNIRQRINMMIGGGQVRVSFDRANRRKVDMLHLEPRHLLGALWLQFALAVGGEKNHRACVCCREWFEVSPETARRSRLYCTEACRSRAYRGRKGRALELAAGGKKPAEVARALGTDVETVKKWLGEIGR